MSLNWKKKKKEHMSWQADLQVDVLHFSLSSVFKGINLLKAEHLELLIFRNPQINHSMDISRSLKNSFSRKNLQ